MKLSKLFLVSLIVINIGGTLAFADYNKGFEYFDKYIKRKAHLESTKFLEILDVNSSDDLKILFKDNGKLLIKKLKDANQTKALEGVNKIIEKHKLKDLEDFLIGIVNGKFPDGYFYFFSLFFFLNLIFLFEND